MRKTGHTLLVVTLVVAAVAVVPGGAMAADGLTVSGDQATDGTVTVTVSENGSAVANASVTVEALNNSTYAGSGDYVTDENGTVGLAAPAQNVTVSVTASANNQTASTTLDLVAPTDGTNETNESEELDTFGARVSAFVASLQEDGNMSGQTVAVFVVDNNPGADNRPDHVDPGPKDDDGEESDEADANDGQANGNNGNGGSDNGNNGNGNGGGNNGNGNGNAGGNGNGNAGGNGPP